MRTIVFYSYGSVDLILHDVHKAMMSLTLKGLYDIARTRLGDVVNLRYLKLGSQISGLPFQWS